MALNVVSNFAANVAHRNLTASESAASNSLAKLSSGSRVVSAKDDAAALAIGSRISAEVAALTQAGVNAGQASSMLQIADGAFSRANDILTRMKTLAVQAASGQLSDTERGILDTEFTALKNEITRIGQDTEFNGVKLLTGSSAVTLVAGFDGDQGIDAVRAFNTDTTSSNMTMSVATAAAGATVTAQDSAGVTYTALVSTSAFTGGTLTAPTSVTLTSSNAQNTGTVSVDLNTAFASGTTISQNTLAVAGTSTTSFTFKVGTGAVAAEDNLTFSLDSLVAIGATVASAITTSGAADTASGQVSTAINSLNTARATVGANQSRLDFASSNIATARENLEAARSQLLDLDVAMEMSTFTSKQILVQAGVSMLAQANQLPQNLLRLFQ